MADVETKPAAAAPGADNDNSKHANSEKDRFSNDRDRNERKRTSDRGGRGGARGRGGRGGRGGRDFKADYKYERKDRDSYRPYKPKTSDDPDAIREQVEFYFSDSNLNKDAFLFDKTGGAENKPVDIETIANFSRMRRFQPFEAIVKALKESDTLEVNDRDQIYRKKPLVALSNDFEENRRLVNERALPSTLYVKGWKPASDIGEIQDTVRDFFKPYGVEEVRIRRHGDGPRVFKGSVFVEFPDLDSAQKFSTQSHTYQGKSLEVLFKKDFIKREVDAFLTEFDSSGFKDDGQKEKALEEARKILEQEYMDPQAPPTIEIKDPQDGAQKTESTEDDLTELVTKGIRKVQKKRNDELQARLKAREEKEKAFNRSGHRHDNKRKRDRDEDVKAGNKESKRTRADGEDESKAANGTTTSKVTDTEAAASNGNDARHSEPSDGTTEAKSADAAAVDVSTTGNEAAT